MPRAKKESMPMSFRISTDIYERIEKYCDETGMSKTSAVERAIAMYIDDYESKKRLIDLSTARDGGRE